MNRKALESLIRAGTFDAFGERNGLLGEVDRIISLAQSEERLRNSSQTSMFDIFGESVAYAPVRPSGAGSAHQ